MLRSAAVLAAVAVHAAADQMRCSGVCEACCPVGLRPDERGDCVDPLQRAPRAPVCRLTTGKCLGGVGPVPCPPVPHPAVRVEVELPGAPPLGIPTVGRWLRDGAPAWPMLETAKFKKVPPHLAGVRATVTESPMLQPGAQAHFDCPPGVEHDCLAFIFVYQCHPCRTASGGLHAELGANNWERSRCGPEFTLGLKESVPHPMTTYIKPVRPGTSEKVAMPTGAEYVVFGMAPGVERPCHTFSREGCDDFEFHGGRCAWQRDTQTCGWNKCRNYGPPTGGCTRCVRDEMKDMMNPFVDPSDKDLDMDRP